MACDAAMAPFVTGEVNPAALEDLVRLCVELDRLRRHPRTGPDGTGPDGTGPDGGDGTGQDDPGSAGQGVGTDNTGTADGAGSGQGAAAQDTARAWEALERATASPRTSTCRRGPKVVRPFPAQMANYALPCRF